MNDIIEMLCKEKHSDINYVISEIKEPCWSNARYSWQNWVPKTLIDNWNYFSEQEKCIIYFMANSIENMQNDWDDE